MSGSQGDLIGGLDVDASPLGVASGKVMLFGEYAVLEGHHALLSATPQRAWTRYLSPISPSPSLLLSDDISREASLSPTLESELSEILREASDRALELTYIVIADPLGVGALCRGLPAQRTRQSTSSAHDPSETGALEDVTLGCSLPFAMTALSTLNATPGVYLINTASFGQRITGRWEKMGIGSSGAATASLIHLIQQRGHVKLLQPSEERAQRFKIACDVHHSAQGRLGSGADIAVSVYGETLRFKGPPHRAISPISQPLPLTWCLWSGGSTSTPQAVRRVREWSQRSPQSYERRIEALVSTEAQAHRVITCATSPETRQEAWRDVITQGGQAARALGEEAGVSIWTSRHQRWSGLISRQGGAIKPSGAGGDDLSIFTAPDLEAAKSCLELLSASAYDRGEPLICFPLHAASDVTSEATSDESVDRHLAKVSSGD